MDAENERAATQDGTDVLGRALVRARALVAGLLLGSLPLRGLWSDALAVDVALMIALPVLVVLLVDLRTLRSMPDDADAGSGPRSLTAHPVVAVGLDVALALGLVYVLDAVTTPIAWVVLALPVIDAAFRSGSGAALAVWASVSGTYLALRFGGDEELTARSLVLSLQQLVGILLIGLPAASVASFIRHRMDTVNEERHQADARAAAVQRLADGARRLTESEDPEGVLDAAVEAGLYLGYARVEVLRRQGRKWELDRVASRHRGPTPNVEYLADRALREELAVVGYADASQMFHLVGLRGCVATLLHRTGTDGDPLVLRLWRDRDLGRSDEEGELGLLLGQHVQAAFANALLHDELERQARYLAHLAAHDSLTGLANRANLLARLDDLLAADPAVALVFLDLDGFKEVNDTFGHDAGDAVLVATARRLEKAVPTDALAVRLGGDEFVVLLPRCSDNVALATAEQLRGVVHEPVTFTGGVAAVGTSVGVASYRLGDDAETLLRRADGAMYEAKRAGGAQVVVAGVEADIEADPASADAADPASADAAG
jgi:diguanylate cyclase (GGDEF)-like protein